MRIPEDPYPPEGRAREGGEREDFDERVREGGRAGGGRVVPVEGEVPVDEEVEVEKVEAVRGVEVVDEEAVVGEVVMTVFPPEARSDSPE